jgi:hypothetical protein
VSTNTVLYLDVTELTEQRRRSGLDYLDTDPTFGSPELVPLTFDELQLSDRVVKNVLKMRTSQWDNVRPRLDDELESGNYTMGYLVWTAYDIVGDILNNFGRPISALVVTKQALLGDDFCSQTPTANRRTGALLRALLNQAQYHKLMFQVVIVDTANDGNVELCTIEEAIATLDDKLLQPQKA